MTQSATALAGAIASLKSAGGTQFVVANQAESFPMNDTAEQGLKIAYDQALFAALASQGVSIIEADINSIRLAIQENPAQYGLTSVSNAAGSTACVAPTGITTAWALLCSSSPGAPSGFASPEADTTSLFADDQHLASAGQKIVANYIYGLLTQNPSAN